MRSWAAYISYSVIRAFVRRHVHFQCSITLWLIVDVRAVCVVGGLAELTKAQLHQLLSQSMLHRDP